MRKTAAKTERRTITDVTGASNARLCVTVSFTFVLLLQLGQHLLINAPLFRCQHLFLVYNNNIRQLPYTFSQQTRQLYVKPANKASTDSRLRPSVQPTMFTC